MIGLVGRISIWLLLSTVSVSLIIHAYAIYKRSQPLRQLSRFAMLLQFIFACTASAALIFLLVTGDFSYAYVADYTSAGLPLIYRIAAFWGGNAGSLLLWALILTLYGSVVAFSAHDDSERMQPVVSLWMSIITLFYAIVLVFDANPFVLSLQPATAGSGLNPLLQNPGMTVHPVNVYLGYIGFTVPFAYAMAGLWLNKTDATWLTVTRRWTLASWLFLSIGIVYGAHWSYEELGWGGYWAWDPVENASLLPWLTATAFLHSSIVQERRGMLKGWNVILITLTFLLTLFGTFLTRSGVLWSIHAFANAPLGSEFLVFLAIIAVICVATVIWRWPSLKAEHQFEAVVSKETAFMLNNVLFLSAAFAVLWGTIFPIISEAFTGQQMMVSGPFYNRVVLPLGVSILFLMAVGPAAAWRRATIKNLSKLTFLAFAASIGLGLFIAAYMHVTYGHSSKLATLAFIGACFAIMTQTGEFYRSLRSRVRLTGDDWITSVVKMVQRHRRTYGGYLVHTAIALMVIGIAGSGAYHVDLQQELSPGQEIQVLNYELTFDGMGVTSGPAIRKLYANIVVNEGNRKLGLLQPAATFYTNGQQPSTNIALYSRPLRDLYVVLLGTQNGSRVILDIHVNPLVQFIWLGGYVLIFGSIISLWPEAKRKKERGGADGARREMRLIRMDEAYVSLAELEYDYMMGKISEPLYRGEKERVTKVIQTLDTTAAGLRERLRTEMDRVDVSCAAQHGERGKGEQ